MNALDPVAEFISVEKALPFLVNPCSGAFPGFEKSCFSDQRGDL